MKTYVFTKPPTVKVAHITWRWDEKETTWQIESFDERYKKIDFTMTGVTSVRVYPWPGSDHFKRYFPLGGVVNIRSYGVVFVVKDGSYVEESFKHLHHICIRKSNREEAHERLD